MCAPSKVQDISLGHSVLLAMAMARYVVAKKGWVIDRKVDFEAHPPYSVGGLLGLPNMTKRKIVVDLLARRPEGYNTGCKIECWLEGEGLTFPAWEPISASVLLHGNTPDLICMFADEGISANQLTF